MSSVVSSRGTGCPSAKARGLGPTGVQPRPLSTTGPPPRQGASVAALRPACASWIAGAAPCSAMKRAMGAHASACASDHRPVSSGLIRPSGRTALASAMTSPAPPTARLPRWTRCHAFGRPSRAEYWHIGETAMRLRSVVSRSRRGVKRALIARCYLPGRMEGTRGAFVEEKRLQALPVAGRFAHGHEARRLQPGLDLVDGTAVPGDAPDRLTACQIIQGLHLNSCRNEFKWTD